MNSKLNFGNPEPKAVKNKSEKRIKEVKKIKCRVAKAKLNAEKSKRKPKVEVRQKPERSINRQ